MITQLKSIGNPIKREVTYSEGGKNKIKDEGLRMKN